MILISHRGNIKGANKMFENSPGYILKAINQGYDVEVDVRLNLGKWFLGHDKAEYPIDDLFLKNDKLWCHAKNLNALEYMLLHNVHCFWHQKDDYTVTNRGAIWTYPGNELTKNSICVMPESLKIDTVPSFCLGVCSDYIERYK